MADGGSDLGGDGLGTDEEELLMMAVAVGVSTMVRVSTTEKV